MATVEAYETKSGRRYQVRYRTPERRQTKRRGFTTKRTAEEFAATVEVRKLQGEYVDAARARVTVGEMGPAWLARQTHLKPSTLRTVEIAWRLQVEPRWGPVRVGDVEFTAVQQWVSELGARRSATVVKRALGVLSAVLNDALRDRRISSNPCVGVKTARKVPKRPEYLSHGQVAALAAAAGKHEAVVLVLGYCGLRWGEMAGLRVRDVDLHRRRLRVEQNAVEVSGGFEVGTPKTHERRSVPYPAFLHDWISELCEGRSRESILFAAEDGSHMRRSRTRRGWFWRAARSVGLEGLAPHDLRHTAASLAVASGANVKAVQRMLGHKSAAMTLDTYADLFDDDLDAVATAMHEAALRSRQPR